VKSKLELQAVFAHKNIQDWCFSLAASGVQDGDSLRMDRKTPPLVDKSAEIECQNKPRISQSDKQLFMYDNHYSLSFRLRMMSLITAPEVDMILSTSAGSHR
jgi:hypothetical protein